jgi:hypothetical protein
MFSLLSLSAKIRAARTVDPNKYEWYVYKGPVIKFFRDKNPLHRKHDLILNPEDMFGIYQTKTHLTYKLVVPNALHIEYSPDKKTVMSILTKSKPTKTVPSAHKVVRTSTRKKDTIWFKPKKKVVGEKKQIDQRNYQWRKLTSEAIDLKDHKGKTRKIKILHSHVFGLRFINKAKGGILVLDKVFKTFRVNTSMYEQLYNSSELLPVQPTHVIDKDKLIKPVKPKDIKKNPKIKRVASRKQPEISDEQIEVGGKPERIRLGRGIKRRFGPDKAPELYDIDIDKDIEDEEQDKKQRKGVNRLPEPEDHPGLEEDFERIYGDLEELDDSDIDEEDEDDTDDIEGDEDEESTEEEDEDNEESEEDEELAEEEMEGDLEDATENEEEPSWDESDDFAVGDILTFNKDKVEREYLILDKKIDPKSSDFTIYTIYDIDNEPDYLQTFRLAAKDNSTKLSKLAELVRKAGRKDLAKYLKLLNTLDVSTKSPYKK